MKILNLHLNVRRFIPVVLAAAATGFLSSCAVTQETLNSDSLFKFTVLNYKQPVEAADWHIDPTQAINPDGEGLNIATAITHGNIEQWLSTWEPTERPALTAEERAKLVEQWTPLKNGHAWVLGRVVAGGDLIIEVAVMDAKEQGMKLRLPIKRVDGVWYQTKLDTTCEYLHWENSKNTIVESIDGKGLEQYLIGVKSSALAQHQVE